MSLSSLAKRVADFAPALGTLIAGPLGAPIGALIADKFGTENTPEAIMSAIDNDPNAGVKLREIEAQELGTKGDVMKAMLLSESKSVHSTRPKIAYQAWQVTGTIVLAITFSYVYAVVTGNEEMINAMSSGWPLILALIAPMVGWLNAYFGILRKEDNDKMNAINGKPNYGLLESFVNKFKK